MDYIFNSIINVFFYFLMLLPAPFIILVAPLFALFVTFLIAHIFYTIDKCSLPINQGEVRIIDRKMITIYEYEIKVQMNNRIGKLRIKKDQFEKLANVDTANINYSNGRLTFNLYVKELLK